MRPPNALSRIVVVALSGAACLVACADDASPPPGPKPLPDPCERTDLDALAAPARHTARWAFEPWISKDISNRADTYDFVDGFRARGIPVGAVVLDSPWETHYNTFVPNPTRYPDMPGMIADMHERGVRVVLWITQMVNDQSYDFENGGGDLYEGPSPNLEEGRRCGFFLDESEPHVWWKGSGAAVDFFNPAARAWWHRQQDPILRAGIDGWKLDFGETYVRSATVRTAEGPKPHQEYSEKYYEDFLAYGRHARGEDFVTMVRAWDESYEFPGRFFAKKEHAPVAWMGDNRRDWIGLADALDHMFVSARAGYVVVGSDVGGYLDRDDKNLLGPEIPLDTLNFARWTAVGALTPFMQLHGRGNLAPWTVTDHVDETVALYKYWATLHHALVPFFYSLAEEAYAGAPPIVRPVGEPASWPGDYRYLLGDAFLVAPILDASGIRSVPLPAGSRWFDWWTGTPADGGTTVQADFATDRTKLPLFAREGAIVALEVGPDDTLGLGPAPSGISRTLLAWPAATPSSFRLHEADGSVTRVEVSKTPAGKGWRVTLSAVPGATILRVRTESAPESVDGAASFSYDAARKTVVAQVNPRSAALTVTAVAP